MAGLQIGGHKARIDTEIGEQLANELARAPVKVPGQADEDLLTPENVVEGLQDAAVFADDIPRGALAPRALEGRWHRSLMDRHVKAPAIRLPEEHFIAVVGDAAGDRIAQDCDELHLGKLPIDALRNDPLRSLAWIALAGRLIIPDWTAHHVPDRYRAPPGLSRTRNAFHMYADQPFAYTSSWLKKG